MKYLIDAGLYGRHLMPIRSELIVERYNECLREIGLAPTGLTEFNIDGSGWSPEIAQEKNETFYLAHGGTNQFALILSPRQNGKPIYHPYYSFSRSIMNEVFERFGRQVADITEETAIVLDIDQNLSHYLNPADLLMVDSVIVRVSAVNGLIEGAQRQRELVNRLMRKDDSWFDQELRNQIIRSAEKFGDLRNRSVIIPSIPINGICNFWSAAFGGVYIFRDESCGQEGLLIMEDDSLCKEVSEEMPGVYSLMDENLLSVMTDRGLLDISSSFYKQHPELLQHKWDCILLDTQLRKCPAIDYESLNQNQKKRLASDLKADLPPEFFQLERFSIQANRGSRIAMKSLSPELRRLLVHPKSKIKPAVRAIIWQLLSEINPLDVVQLYAYNKKRFFREYDGWPESKKIWSADLLRETYEPQGKGNIKW